MIRSRAAIGAPTAVALVLLIVAGAVLFVVTKERPRDFTGFPPLLVPLVGATALTRGDLAAGLGAATLSLALGCFLGLTAAVLTAALAVMGRVL